MGYSEEYIRTSALTLTPTVHSQDYKQQVRTRWMQDRPSSDGSGLERTSFCEALMNAW